MQFRPQSGQSAGRERTEEQGEGRHPSLKPLQLPRLWAATHSQKPRQGFLPLSIQGWDPQLPRNWILEARAMPSTNTLPHSELWVRRQLGCREICPGATQRNPLPKVPCMVQEQTGPRNYVRPFGSKCERRAIVREGNQAGNTSGSPTPLTSRTLVAQPHRRSRPLGMSRTGRKGSPEGGAKKQLSEFILDSSST